MAEELRFEKLLRDRPAVDRDERAGRPVCFKTLPSLRVPENDRAEIVRLALTAPGPQKPLEKPPEL